MKTLHLTLKKKWFDMIASGVKKEEYREIKSYWDKRLMELNDLGEITDKKDFDIIQFRNGYSKDAPVLIVEFKGVVFGEAKPEWSDNAKGMYYVISLGKILNEVIRPQAIKP